MNDRRQVTKRQLIPLLQKLQEPRLYTIVNRSTPTQRPRNSISILTTSRSMASVIRAT